MRIIIVTELDLTNATQRIIDEKTVNNVHDFKINRKKTKATILQIAIFSKRLDLISLLIKNGAECNSAIMECAISTYNIDVYNALVNFCPHNVLRTTIDGNKNPTGEEKVTISPIVNIYKCLTFKNKNTPDYNFIQYLINKKVLKSTHFAHFIILAMKNCCHSIAQLLLRTYSDNIFYKKNKYGESAYTYWETISDRKIKRVFAKYIISRNNVLSTLIRVKYRSFIAFRTIFECESPSTQNLFAIAHNKKLHHILYYALNDDNVNVLDENGNSLMYYYVTNANWHCSDTMQQFLEYNGKIIINGKTMTAPYNTSSVILAMDFPRIFTLRLKNGESYATTIVKNDMVGKTQTLIILRSLISTDKIEPHHRNNNNETIIDVIHKSCKFTRSQKNNLITKLCYKYSLDHPLIDKLYKSRNISNVVVSCPLCRRYPAKIVNIAESVSFECVICMETRNTNFKLSCKHSDFCVTCIRKMNKSRFNTEDEFALDSENYFDTNTPLAEEPEDYTSGEEEMTEVVTLINELNALMEQDPTNADTIIASIDRLESVGP